MKVHIIDTIKFHKTKFRDHIDSSEETCVHKATRNICWETVFRPILSCYNELDCFMQIALAFVSDVYFWKASYCCPICSQQAMLFLAHFIGRRALL